MLGLLGKGIKKIFGTKSDKDLKLLYPYVDKINSEFNKLSSISDQELRDKTVSFKEKISANTKKVSDQIKSLKEDYINEKEQNIELKEEILDKIDKLSVEEKEIIEDTVEETTLGKPEIPLKSANNSLKKLNTLTLLTSF